MRQPYHSTYGTAGSLTNIVHADDTPDLTYAYDPEGRPVAVWGATYPVAYELNDATDLVDFLGLWKFVPRGKNWTPERREYFSERLAEVKTAVEKMLQRMDSLISKAQSISDDCWFKEPVLRNLKNWKLMCLQNISAGLNSDELELPVRLGDLGENSGGRP